MDIKREPPKQTKKYIGIALGLVAIVTVSVAVSRLKPAAPPVERGTLWFDTVKRGEMKREVNAPGTLEAMYVRNVTALTSGRVEDLPVRPGIQVTPATVLVVLSSPDEDTPEEVRALLEAQLAGTPVADEPGMEQGATTDVGQGRDIRVLEGGRVGGVWAIEGDTAFIVLEQENDQWLVDEVIDIVEDDGAANGTPTS